MTMRWESLRKLSQWLRLVAKTPFAGGGGDGPRRNPNTIGRVFLLDRTEGRGPFPVVARQSRLARERRAFDVSNRGARRHHTRSERLTRIKSPASLEKQKIYQALPGADAPKHRQVTVIDESGDDYLYPEEYFVPIQPPKAAERALVTVPQQSRSNHRLEISASGVFVPGKAERGMVVSAHVAMPPRTRVVSRRRLDQSLNCCLTGEGG